MSDEEYMDCSDEDFAPDDYYNDDDDADLDPRSADPEHLIFNCLTVEEVEKLLNESVETSCNALAITPSLAKTLLHGHKWAVENIITKYREDPNGLLESSNIKPPGKNVIEKCQDASESFQVLQTKQANVSEPIDLECCVCTRVQPSDVFFSLACGHLFCKNCWEIYFEIQIFQRVCSGIECMTKDCSIVASEDFVLMLLTRPEMREKYSEFMFLDYVRSHPQLRLCPGPNCKIIIRAKEPFAKRVVCNGCTTSFCFGCGLDYHAPTDCITMQQWLINFADERLSATYIQAFTKRCPGCQSVIEKCGGCNHMRCATCSLDFCWMCLGNWSSHNDYYTCSQYKENPEAVAEQRESFSRYFHHYERWENHSMSLKLEENTLEVIKKRINLKVMSASGTWIDWQYLLDAAALLAKCRYTLKYTYPYAYYMEKGPRKELFEYQQAQLEADVEKLSWKIERAETTDRADLENQMDIVEKKRITLLKDFLQS